MKLLAIFIHYSIIFLMHYLKVTFPPSVVLSPVPGELLGVDYLYSQTGKALQDVHPDSEETEALLYAAHHQVRLTTGHFRCSKKRPEFTPGVESTTRCVLASSGSPAQWPDSSRLVESICVKLCNIHKSPKKQGSYSLTVRSGSWSWGMPQ